METPCVRWPGPHRSSDGRPLWPGGRFAYRVLYELAHGVTLTRSTILHHECENTWCVEVAHLTAMTQGEHLRAHDYWRTTHPVVDTCIAGHPFTPENTYLSRPARSGPAQFWRQCRTCRAERKRRARRLTRV